MTEQIQQPSEVFAVFVGAIDQDAVKSIAGGIAAACQRGIQRAHIMIQSNGGNPSDGVALYNLFKASPIYVIAYNCGNVSSAAVIAFLGAKERKTSAFATFMIHRTISNVARANASRLEALTKDMALFDAASEAILREHVRLSEDQWNLHNFQELWLSAQDAVAAGIATSVGEFAPTLGQPLYVFD